MRVALFNTLYPTSADPRIVGGAERSVRILAEALVQNGHDVLVVKALPPGSEPACERVEGVQVAGVPIQNSYWPYFGHAHHAIERLLWHARDDRAHKHALVMQHLDAFRPNVVHTNNLSGLTTFVWRAARRCGAPIVHTLRDYYLLCARSIRFRNERNCKTTCLECRLLTICRRRETTLVDVAVGISRAVLETHLRHDLFRSAKWRGVIHNPVLPRSVPPPRPKRDVTFGYIGSVTKGKGVYLLAQAYGRLRGDARLLIAGTADAETRQMLQELAGNRLITFTGFVTPEEFYPHVDVVVVPSLLHESLSRAVLEAHSFSRPVIGARRGGIPEALGDGGWLFEPDTPDDLVAIMQRVLDQPESIVTKATLGMAAIDRFAPQKIAAEYERAYEAALKATGEPSMAGLPSQPG